MASQLNRESAQGTEPRSSWQDKLAHAAYIEAGLVCLSFVWLVLVGIEFILGERTGTTVALYAIWAIFLVDFVARLFMTPDKLGYLRANSLTALSLVLPVFRVFRFMRILRVTRLARLLKVLGSFNRAFRALGRTLNNRGLPYVALLTAVITLLGAAGFYAFEKPPHGTISDYGNALWFTAMLMTTMGSSYWPVSAEGRLLCFLLSFYAFAVFGYFTAALASFFIGRQEPDGNVYDTLTEISERIRRLEEKAL